MTTTVKQQTSNGTMVFTQRTEQEARQLFEQGYTISVMTADREPNTSLTSEVNYTKGEELFYDSSNIACNFDQVIKDFADWQDNDGYGHMPDHEAAENHAFSYWTCQVVR